jgi:hypothetical protein
MTNNVKISSQEKNSNKEKCDLLFKQYREKIFQKRNAEAHEIKALDDEIDAILDSYQRYKAELEKLDNQKD